MQGNANYREGCASIGFIITMVFQSDLRCVLCLQKREREGEREHLRVTSSCINYDRIYFSEQFLYSFIFIITNCQGLEAKFSQ